jgi:hypothetical protein
MYVIKCCKMIRINICVEMIKVCMNSCYDYYGFGITVVHA